MPGPGFTLYWSNLELYENCPRKFLWSRGWDGIDCGGGVGKKKPPPEKDSRHHAVMGQVIQKVIENLYNDELWREPKGLPDRLESMVEREFNFEMERNYIDWTEAPPRGDMLDTCKQGVRGFLRTLFHNKLLGTYAKAEVLLLNSIGEGNPIGGRADVIIQQDGVVTILDGKNSMTKGKYTDPDQLRWYGLLYYLQYGKLPERLGFVYYRYPYNAETGESGIDWVDCTKEDIERIASRAVEARKKMIKHEFNPVPMPKVCNLCEYQTVCPERIAQREANAARRKKKPQSEETFIGVQELDINS